MKSLWSGFKYKINAAIVGGGRGRNQKPNRAEQQQQEEPTETDEEYNKGEVAL